MERLSSDRVPDHRGLPLVGDADASDLGGINPSFGQRPGDHLLRLGPDFGRVMLHPARLGIDLAVLFVVGRHHLSRLVENHETGAGGALIHSSGIADVPRLRLGLQRVLDTSSLSGLRIVD